MFHNENHTSSYDMNQSLPYSSLSHIECHSWHMSMLCFKEQSMAREYGKAPGVESGPCWEPTFTAMLHGIGTPELQQSIYTASSIQDDT